MAPKKRPTHVCGLCGISTKSAYDFARHCRTKRHARLEGDPRVDARKHLFYCGGCEFRTGNPETWETHLARPEHVKRDFAPLVCPHWWCTHWATDDETLQAHVARCSKNRVDLGLPLLPSIPPCSNRQCKTEWGFNGVRTLYECAKRDACKRLVHQFYKSEFRRLAKNELDDDVVVIAGEKIGVFVGEDIRPNALVVQLADGTVVSPKNKQAGKIWNALRRELEPDATDEGIEPLVRALREYVAHLLFEQMGPMRGPTGSMWYFVAEDGSFGRPSEAKLVAMKLVDPTPTDA